MRMSLVAATRSPRASGGRRALRVLELACRENIARLDVAGITRRREPPQRFTDEDAELTLEQAQGLASLSGGDVHPLEPFHGT